MKLNTEWLFRDVQFDFDLTSVGECENKDSEYGCSCSYNKCYIITGIESQGRGRKELKENLVERTIPEGEPASEELKNKIKAVFDEYDFENMDLFDYQTERGYYGEYLSSLTLKVAQEIAEKLKLLES